MPFQCLYCFSR